MKIFEFDPTTGRRGAQIDSKRLASWTDQSLEYQVREGLIADIPHHAPVGFGRDAHARVHVDAGFDTKSYADPDRWVCFCLGELRTGQDSGVWEWVVLPPSQVREAAVAEVAA